MGKIKSVISRNKKLFLIALIISIVGHFYFIKNQYLGNSYMGGSGDQFSQMIIFKNYLYNQLKEGNFIYSFTYNGGGNFLSRLSYYYSTSILFYLTSIITFFLEILNVIPEPNIHFWAKSILYVSIIRSFFIIIFSTKFIEMFDIKRKIAILGASIYALSMIYFRHTSLWEMFSDAIIWFPILLIGAEKIIRKEKGWVFSVGVFLTLFNNAAFGYVNLLFTGLYALLRMIFKLTEDELKPIEQVKTYLLFGIIGVGVSLPGLIQFVLGFHQTSRLTADFNVEFFNFQLSNIANHLYSGSVFVVPIIFAIVVLVKSNYKNRVFTFFATLSIFLIILVNNSLVASVMNGFGHPQYRWPYVIYLFLGTAVAIGISEMVKNKNYVKTVREISLSLIVTTIIYYLVKFKYMQDSSLSLVQYIPWILGVQILLFGSYFVFTKKYSQNIFLIGTLGIYMITIFMNNQQLSYQYNFFSRDSTFYELFSNENEEFEQAIDIVKNDSTDFFRIDASKLPNFGLIHNIPTLNNYSSFQNKNQQFFNRYFEIDTSIDSNGVIDGLAGRRNLNALLNVDYIITENEDTYKVPYGYELFDMQGEYSIYKNNKELAFIHPVYNLVSYEEADSLSFKDDLILDYAIVPNEYKNTNIDAKYKELNYLNYELSFNNINYFDNIVQVLGDSPTIDINISDTEIDLNAETIVIEYYLKPSAKYSRHDYKINEHHFELEGYLNQYSSQLFKNQVHLSNTENIKFELDSNSNYEFEILNLYTINSDAIEKRYLTDQLLDYDIIINNDSVKINFNNNQNYPFMVVPIFNEMGWEVYINDKREEIIDTNNGMIGFSIPEGQVSINIKFKPPYLYSSILISLISLLVLYLINKKRSIL